MPEISAKILLVEDEPSIRTSMSLVLAECGYCVRCAEDGFSALSEIRQEMPDILLSDLNMPGMSGFELLSVVRRRFPVLHTIAMSGAFSGDEVPPGIAADAFYPKGGGVEALLEILLTLPPAEEHLCRTSSATAPLWIHRGGGDSSQDAYITIACPECLRTFPQALCASVDRTHTTKCLYCQSPIHFVIAEPVDRPPLPALHTIQVKSEPALKSTAHYYY